ncbi:hypothetical protein [Halorussus sp. AFM4]
MGRIVESDDNGGAEDENLATFLVEMRSTDEVSVDPVEVVRGLRESDRP